MNKIFNQTFLKSKKGIKANEKYYIEGLDELRQRLTALQMTKKWTPNVFTYKKDSDTIKKIEDNIRESRDLASNLLERIKEYEKGETKIGQTNKGITIDKKEFDLISKVKSEAYLWEKGHPRTKNYNKSTFAGSFNSLKQGILYKNPEFLVSIMINGKQQLTQNNLIGTDRVDIMTFEYLLYKGLEIGVLDTEKYVKNNDVKAIVYFVEDSIIKKRVFKLLGENKFKEVT